MVVLTGRDKGRVGNVLKVLPAEDRVVVENVNLVKRHTKPRPDLNQSGGIVEKEASIHVSNVSLYNPITKKPDRVRFKVLADSRKVRVFKSSGEVVDA